MNNHTTNCQNCNHNLRTVSLQEIAIYGSRWACPVCGYVMDYAAQQVSRPGLSPEAKQAWTTVGVAAFAMGLLMLFDHLDRLA
jgi:hypothetical protein